MAPEPLLSERRAERRCTPRRSAHPCISAPPVRLSVLGPPEPVLREGGDSGPPVGFSDPASPAAVVLRAVAKGLAQRSRGLSGRSLGVSPVKR